MENLQEQIDKIWWWHSIDLHNGMVTPGYSQCQAQLSYIKIPSDLQGKTVLDIGAWDGFFSFVAEERGAIVTATDDVEHSWGKCASGKKGFDLAKSVRNSQVKEYPSAVNDLSSSKIGQFDIVFCFGVFYHVKDPYRMLEIIYDLTKEMAIIETASTRNDIDVPLLDFYHINEMKNPEDGNYFSPNLQCLIKMLYAVGFSRVEPTMEYPKITEPIRIAVHAYKI